MPIILEETAVCPKAGMAKAAPAPAVIFRKSRRFTSWLNMDYSYFLWWQPMSMLPDLTRGAPSRSTSPTGIPSVAPAVFDKMRVGKDGHCPRTQHACQPDNQ